MPLAVGISSYWEVPSWDRYRIPKPFAKAKLVPGPFMFVPPDTGGQDLETYRRELEETLKNLQEEVDAEMASGAAPATTTATPPTATSGTRR